MLAYKFLDRHGRAPFTLTPWIPGVWVEATSAVPCHEGVHACRAEHLSYWLADTLWEVDLDEPVIETRHKLTARRGRLVCPVDDYRAAVEELGARCAWQARDRAVELLRRAGADAVAEGLAAATTLEELRAQRRRLDDSTFEGTAGALAADAADFALARIPAETPFIAACAAAHAATGPGGDRAAWEAAFSAERAAQSRWLAERLGLAA